MQRYRAHDRERVGCEAATPLHVDNVGLPDTRVVTVIMYLNPDWADVAGNERLSGGGADDGGSHGAGLAAKEMRAPARKRIREKKPPGGGAP